jgi:transposase
MNQGIKRQRYDKNFKNMIVELVQSKQKTVSEIHREYGVTKVTIYSWLKILGKEQANDDPLTKEEVFELKKEILKLKEENEILKKAMAIFAKKQRVKNL